MEHIYVFIVCFFLSLSIVGYGIIFKKLLWTNNAINFEYSGLLGLIFLTFISYLSNFFFKHDYIHNLIIHIIGISSFFFYLDIKKNIQNIKLLFLLLLILYPSIYIFKTHDDFPYYHLPYINNLIENKLLIGNGNFSIAHRTHSSLFYYISIYYLPIFKFKIINFSYLSFLLFFNFYLLKNLIYKKKLLETNFLFFIKLFSFIFVNVIFYRLSEYGTDRVGQIFLFLLIIFILTELNSIGKSEDNINFSILLLIFLITQKTYYISYLIVFFPLLFFYLKKKDKIIKNFLTKTSIFFIFIFIIFLLKNYLNNGCLIYPITITCSDNLLWAQKLNEIKYLNSWYELWSKAGANPNFRVSNPNEYIQGLNWLSNWYESYFKFKVTDFLLGVISISLIIYLSFYTKSKTKNKNNILSLYLFLIILFLVWFFKHPSLRYGGYTLIGLLIFLPISVLCSNFTKSFKNKKIITYVLIIITFFIFDFRNIKRIQKEINIYSYSIFKKPFLFIKNVDYKTLDVGTNKIFVPKNSEMCWLTKSPCSYKENLISTKKYKYVIYYEKN